MVIEHGAKTIARAASEVPGSVWIVIATQLAALVIWGARIDSRVAAIESHHLEIDRRLERIDNDGSRRLQMVEERLNQAREQNLQQQRQLDWLITQSGYRVKPPGASPP